MRTHSAITLVLVTLASWTLFCHAVPAGLIESISPEKGVEYNVGGSILAQVRIIDEELHDPQVKLTFQRAIPKPDINIHIADVNLSELSKNGYEFEVLKEFQGDKRVNCYRVRYSFQDNEGEAQYVDSGDFKIFPH
ncbi:hypothetical protein BGZ82_007588 [Podila clonocystis]|nr:hypothetical protein BGZ82_007588 [Podila clonocystis]